LRSVFEALDRYAASVDLVAISEVNMSFTMASKHLPAPLIADLQRVADVTCESQQAIVCLVGEDIHGKPGIAASVFEVVAQAGVNIRMISQGASEINISFVIQESDVPRAVRHLHARFFTQETPAAARPFVGKSAAKLVVNGSGGARNSKRAVLTKTKISTGRGK
jgi:aspartate kinase